MFSAQREEGAGRKGRLCIRWCNLRCCVYMVCVASLGRLGEGEGSLSLLSQCSDAERRMIITSRHPWWKFNWGLMHQGFVACAVIDME